jgi:hypothetical protein
MIPVRLATAAAVRADGLQHVAGPPVMEEEDSLPDPPKRSCPELIGTSAALSDSVLEISAHVVEQQVGEIGSRSGWKGRRLSCCSRSSSLSNRSMTHWQDDCEWLGHGSGKRRRVAKGAANHSEGRSSIHD